MPSPYHHRFRRPRTCRPVLQLAILLVLGCVCSMHAQYRQWRDTTLPWMQPLYGLDSSRFSIGAQLYLNPASGPFTSLWQVADTLGIDNLDLGVWAEDSAYRALYVRMGYADIDSMNSTAGNRRMVVNDNLVNTASQGREVQFYPFNEVQSPYFVWKFTDIPSEGKTDTNATEKGHPFEKVFDSMTATPGHVIAQHIAFDWNDKQQYRYEYGFTADDDSVQNASDFFASRTFKPDQEVTYSVIATGHLFDNGQFSTSDSLFKIIVVYEVPDSTTYSNTNTTSTTASGNLEFPIDTLYVQQSDFYPDTTPKVWDKYREKSFPINLAHCKDGTPGPLFVHQTNPAPRIDIRVYWLGGERVALRSIALRDSLGERVLGLTDSSVSYREQIMNAARRVMRGANLFDTTFRQSIISLDGNDEPSPYRFAAYNFIDQMLRDTFHLAGDTVHSLPLSLPQLPSWRNTWENFHYLARPTDVNLYIYPYGTIDTVPKAQLSVDYYRTPQLREHNGSRFHIPLLDLDTSYSRARCDSVIESYERFQQRAMLGRNQLTNPDLIGLSYYQYGYLYTLGVTARISRAYGRPLVPYLGPATWIGFSHDTATGLLDTNVQHMLEPAEIRLMSHLSLCYGAWGAKWYHLGGGNMFLHEDSTGIAEFGSMEGTYPHPYNDSNVISDYWFRCAFRTKDSSGITKRDSTGLVSIPNFYTGFRNNREAVEWVNKELFRKLGDTMVRRRLRWRDSYSIQQSVATPGTYDTTSAFQKRPLPSDEIITNVESFNTRTGAKDSLWATYVELGLFETKPGTIALHDTNYCYIVNRRALERPSDIPASSPRGRMLDTLAESRLIRLRFHLKHPDSVSQYNFIRVREVAPDTTRLPLAAFPRQGLDSAIYADSSAEVVLRAGAGCLLEITYLPPADTVPGGDLRFNGQRKIVWDGRRYHLVSTRYSNGDSRVYYRRSMYIQRPQNDTATPEIGQIHWEPHEIRISDSSDAQHSDHRWTENTQWRSCSSGSIKTTPVN